ncbi:enoyl-CoA hydratase/isomerase family protein [Pelagibacterium lacus]|uniref:3-hydroxyisobutyryl-CoA hydrolase n=1 Tax=Pelagibacterium lacus TaxID=2282655 RepID=A0A369W488_9HYPH|nr:enoyl-CoA hydratase/isomerase family protein [Pelagibacterium lacus]RDE08072.1 enoyl-CoA hydratase/isomerase family protein [Pelagibacterium lacus]
MDPFVKFAVSEACGIVTLARSGAINALTAEMIADVLDTLHDWERDPGIAMVVIEGEGEKGLCAGGDVRATRELALAGRVEAVGAFFADEYQMNGLISSFPKPIVALQHGIVMGGGIGISSHARYRVATLDARFAMPEGAIGFFCDVGVNALLYKTGEARALAFLLSGQTVGAADAIGLGLADAAVPRAALGSLRDRLIEASVAGDLDLAIAAAIQAEADDPGVAGFCALADTLAPAFEKPDAEAILAELRDLGDDGDPGAAALYGAIAGHCPTSVVATLLSHRLARRQRDVMAILRTDLALARWMALRPDFAEGVRAVLVDKDRRPRWLPDRLADVDRVGLDALLSPVPAQAER